MTDVELRDPQNRVSSRAVTFWTVRALLGWLVVGAVETLVLFIGAQPSTSWRVGVVGVTVILAAAHLIVMPRWRFRVHRWEVTPTAVYTQAGWLRQERRIAPVSRIQTVDSDRGPLEQLFTLSNVTVTTASAAGPLKIHGLDVATAERLVHELTSRDIDGDAT